VRKIQNLLKSEFRTSSPNDRDAFTKQLREEIYFAENIHRERENGVMGAPVLVIDIPTSGRLYRFSKTMVDGEELCVDFQYIKGWLGTAFHLLILVVIGVIIYLLRPQIKRSIAWSQAWAANHKDFWNKCKTPRGARIILGIAIVIFWFLSKVLFVVFVLLFLLAWLKPEWIFRKKITPE
jgi:hypothetical protein